MIGDLLMPPLLNVIMETHLRLFIMQILCA